MSSLRDVKNSKYLAKEDIGQGILVTINKVDKANVALEGNAPEMKFTVHFDEVTKPLVLNTTNAEIIAEIAKADEDIENTWLGHQIVLYVDPNVSFGGKRTGGIRVRAPRNITDKPDLPF